MTIYNEQHGGSSASTPPLVSASRLAITLSESRIRVMSALSAVKLCGLATIGGVALYALKYSGGKKNSPFSFASLTKDPVLATEAGMMVLNTSLFVGAVYCIANYGELLSVA